MLQLAESLLLLGSFSHPLRACSHTGRLSGRFPLKVFEEPLGRAVTRNMLKKQIWKQFALIGTLFMHFAIGHLGRRRVHCG